MSSIARIYGFGLAVLVLLPTVGFSADHEIRTSRTDFEPSAKAVRVGDTVTWVSDNPVLHEIDFSGDPTGMEGKPLYRILKRKPVSITVQTPGLYRYACKWHGMFATLEVLP
jgi:plastocyanin